MLIRLPNGLVESSGMELFDYAEIDELKGKQQNYLVDESLVIGNIGHVQKILEDLVLSFQNEQGLRWKGKISSGIQRLPVEDLEVILIRIREKTFGPEYFLSAKCDKCGSEIKNLKLDLSKLEVDKLSLDEMMEPKVVHLPKMDIEIELGPLRLKELLESLKLIKDKKDSLITGFLKLSMRRMGEKTNITNADIEKIPASDIYYLNKEAKNIKLMGNIDTNIQVKCTNKKCKQEFEFKLNPFDPDFFDPSRGSIT